jgi:uncharacterized protein
VTKDDFLEQRTLAVVGVSRNKKGFGYAVYQDLLKHGYTVYPVNPGADNIDGKPCFPSLTSLPEPVGGAVLVVPPAQSEKVVEDALASGLRRLWFQPGSDSAAALSFCKEHSIETVSTSCILMYLEPVKSIHRIHRGIQKVFGKYSRN